MNRSSDTIAAIATPPGAGAIAVIRVSGPDAESLARRLFHPARPKNRLESHRLHHGRIIAPEDGVVLDDVLAVLMRGPSSYTGEDILEIHCHGGPFLPQRILAEILRAGARPAEPGEFTRRAFLNGRMTLEQAEGVADLIAAGSDRAVAAARGLRDGRLGQRVDAVAEDLMGVLASLEADLDFSEDERSDPEGRADLRGHLSRIAEDLRGIAATHAAGSIVRQGAAIVIAGRVNVGKSSLLNRLLGEKRAIVTPVAGTTRDFIEEAFDLDGLTVRIIDTAGIRRTDDTVEQAGMDLVWEKADAADMILLLLDGSAPLTQEDREIAARCGNRSVLPVVNKIDLPPLLDEDDLRALFPGIAPVRISAKRGDGIADLKASLATRLHQDGSEIPPSVMVTRLRHRIALEKAAKCLDAATMAADGSAFPELLAADIREAAAALGDITGKTATDDLLDRIFAEFCVGK